MITAAPLRKVTNSYVERYGIRNSFKVDELECGHVFTRDMKSKEAKRRRCWGCAAKKLHGK